MLYDSCVAVAAAVENVVATTPVLYVAVPGTITILFVIVPNTILLAEIEYTGVPPDVTPSARILA
jgi:hypothetical protein